MNTVVTYEKLFYLFDNTATLIQKEMDITYLEALIETSENIFHGEIHAHNEVFKQQLKKEYEKEQLESYSKDEIRKAFQLAILKGMKEGTQPHHEMTPDAVALFLSYLLNKMTESKEKFSLFDPAIGTGNLMSALINNSKKKIAGFGSDVDETLLKLCYANANLQENSIELYHQDSFKPLYLSKTDFIVSDLPLGYYPNDAVAKTYKLKADKGHSYSHYLMIEQSLNYVKDDGYCLLMIPNFTFEGEQAEKLNKYLRENAYIIGLLKLPLSLFKNEKFAKSILILQKKGTTAKQPHQVLLADLPKFSNMKAMESMMAQMNDWFSKEWSTR
ncbi:SAM-dependent methyltransferase [Lottiidibacillus patelloidae]|uniref:SAM-dependent methyltransferase n=1 Tax=Lottiidibacillus patelloidae TaxID=2670334 RepID=A0A263BXT8_9BACI|nr:class I SAM-dependent methyltransferase [Lottiidibacillus patelloidae]OZM57986.1 SAM-dependent methyltransferase [Lottiidibacillus patelloidae]